MLKVRFKDIGLRRIEKGQFALEYTMRKKSLQLSDAWSTVVRPGQHISMSMVFRSHETSTTSCPWCKHENDSADDTEVECANIACRGTYRRIVDISFPDDGQREEDREQDSIYIAASTSKSRNGRADSQDDEMDDEMTQYTRVQILTKNPPVKSISNFPPIDTGYAMARTSSYGSSDFSYAARDLFLLNPPPQQSNPSQNYQVLGYPVQSYAPSGLRLFNQQSTSYPYNNQQSPDIEIVRTAPISSSRHKKKRRPR